MKISEMQITLVSDVDDPPALASTRVISMRNGAWEVNGVLSVDDVALLHRANELAGSYNDADDVKRGRHPGGGGAAVARTSRVREPR